MATQPVGAKETQSFTATGSSDSFQPQVGPNGATFYVSLNGTAVATMALERSYDGTTWHGIYAGGEQIYLWSYNSTPLVEQVFETEAGVLYRLRCTAYTSGTVEGRISQ